MTMNPTELKGALEAIIYAADEPATLDQIANAVGEEKASVRAALDEMIAGYAGEDRGMEIRAVAGGYRFYTKPQHHDVVRRFIKSLRPPLRLTMPALETLAVISYRQPVTGPEIQEIRGVNVSGVIKTLLEKRLIITAGRKAVMGRPDPVPHVEGIPDALRPFRSRRIAEPEGIRATRARRAGIGRRHRAHRAGERNLSNAADASNAAMLRPTRHPASER